MDNKNKTKKEASVEAFNLAQRIWNAGKNWNRNNDGLDVPSSAILIDELVEQRSETGQVDAIVTLLHEEAEKFEEQGLIQGKIGNTHDMHGKMDTARCFRVAANTLSGDQAG